MFALDRAGNDTTYYFDYVPDSIAVFPDTTDFGIVQNNASAVDTIVLVNPLSDNVSIDSLWLQGNESFSIVGESAPLRVNLLRGDTERIYVKFSPGKGNVSDSATIMAQFDCFSRPLTVVSGTTGVPCVEVNNLDFSDLAFNQKSNRVQADSQLLIENLGYDTLRIEGLRINGGAGAEFSITVMPSLPQYLPPSGSCAFNHVLRGYAG